MDSEWEIEPLPGAKVEVREDGVIVFEGWSVMHKDPSYNYGPMLVSEDPSAGIAILEWLKGEMVHYVVSRGV